MTGTGRARRAAGALVLALAATVGVAIVPPAAAPVLPALAVLDASIARAADDIDIGTSARYVIVPDKGLVRVAVDVVAVNQHADQTVGGVTTRFFYDGINLGVQPEATHVQATRDGARLKVTTTRRTGYRLVSIRFGANLYYRQSAKVRLTFDLPAGQPRSSSDVRVGTAFASFLAWAFGDHGTVRVQVPAAFDANVSGATMDESVDNQGNEILTASAPNAVEWYAWVDARNDDGLTRDQLTLADGEQVIVRAWPEDTRWRKRVTAILSEGVPDLARAIGLPWPVDGPLNVLEIHTPLLEGYAGFYDTSHDEITISEDLDDQTIVHEASHAWFNSGLFTERWITEGLADEYASLVLEANGHKAASPDKVKPTAKVAFPLADWPPPAPIADPESDAREQYGYNAAWTVVRKVVTSAGEDGMRLVLRAAANDTTAYPGSGLPEKTQLPNDWRRFLDLTEELGGATGVSALMATWVVPPSSAGVLEDRATARADYHALVDAGGTWAAPVVVRMALDGWSFGTAEARIADAQAVLAQRDATATLAASAGLTPAPGLERAYEAADSTASLNAAAMLAANTETSLDAIIAATTTAAAPRDWLVTLGLTGKDPDAMLATARAAWQAGDLTTATDQATLASGTLAVAAEAGRGRAIVLGSGVALLLLALALIALVLRRQRRQMARRRTAVAAALAAPTGGGASWTWTPGTGAADAPTEVQPPADPADPARPADPALGVSPEPPPEAVADPLLAGLAGSARRPAAPPGPEPPGPEPPGPEPPGHEPPGPEPAPPPSDPPPAGPPPPPSPPAWRPPA